MLDYAMYLLLKDLKCGLVSATVKEFDWKKIARVVKVK